MQNISGKWDLAYDWHNLGNFILVRFVINTDGTCSFPDFTDSDGRWSQVDGNIVFRFNAYTGTTYAGHTTGNVMMGMIDYKYMEVDYVTTGTWFAINANAHITVYSSFNDIFKANKKIDKKILPFKPPPKKGGK